MKLKKDEKKHLRRFDDLDIVDAFKAMGNQYRMKILISLSEQSGINLDQINQLCGGEFKNISVHTKKLEQAGLVHKQYRGAAVQHRLTPYGQIAVRAFKLFQKDPF